MTTTTDSGRAGRRRSETRTRLLAAALEVLGEQGLARSSVENVCERAGFTRGAFYSNFTSMDDVVTALFTDRAQHLVEQVEERSTGQDAGSDVGSVVAHVLAVLPVDRQWHAVRTEFTAQALRNPEAAHTLAQQRAALCRRLAPVLEEALTRVGRRLTASADELARSLVATHDGLVTPRLLGADPDDPALVARVLTGVVLALTEEVRP